MSLTRPGKEQLNVLRWNWDNSYARLPEVLFQRVLPARFRAPQLVIFNQKLAQEMGLYTAPVSGNQDPLSKEHAAKVFSGQVIPEGAEPIAQAYAGHQYGGFTILGDGRAILLGEHLAPGGMRLDIQFKGSGPTLYSRRGDGLAALGSMLREYIISEAMAALGIPSTRSLAVVSTGETVQRERTLPGAVLTRVAASHIRVGTFQFLLAQRNFDVLKQLADYTIARHFPEIREAPNPYLELLRESCQRQATLIAQWQVVGFIHGVMNTDNMAISGETIDYGPCAFMDTYHPATVFSSIDNFGRYAYTNQPRIAQWNLARFAETLLTLIHEDQEQAIAQAMDVLEQFPTWFEQAWLAGMRKKLGLSTAQADDGVLIQRLLSWMEQTEADFANTFRWLSSPALAQEAVSQSATFQNWYRDWQNRLKEDGRSYEEQVALMQSVNPSVIPRNHRVEEALAAAQNENDLTVMQRLLAALENPFEEKKEFEAYRSPAPPNECGYQTFCGT
jgi:serine/tyrosine/threonine adenylyltransferase